MAWKWPRRVLRVFSKVFEVVNGLEREEAAVEGERGVGGRDEGRFLQVEV